MSDINHDAADIYTNWQSAAWDELTSALNAAERDARLKGVGFVKVKPGPVYEHVSLSEVFQTIESMEASDG